MNERMRAGWAGVLISAALLSACGGGGDDSPPPAPPVQGVAIPDNLAIAASATTDIASATAFTSNVAATAGLTYAWTFGDGTTSTESSPKHDFAKVGDYQVSLKVSNAAGASKEVKWAVTVFNRAHVQGLSCTAADNAGWCWQAPRPTGSVQNDFHFVNASTGWSVGDNGEILRTLDGGITWTRQASGVTARLTGVSFTDANSGWVAGDFGALLRTTDGGAHWTLQPTGTQQLSSPTVQTAGANVVLLTGYSGGIRMSTDGGATWTQATSWNNYMLGAEGVLWSINYQGLSKSVDLGKSSSVVQAFDGSPNSYVFHTAGRSAMAVTFGANYNVYPYVYSQTVYTSVDNGQTWTRITPAGLPTNAYAYGSALTVMDASTAVMQVSGQLHRTVDGGRVWTPVAVPAGVTPTYQRVGTGDWVRSYYQSGSGGSVSELSEDAGLTWHRINADYLGSTVKRVDASTWVARTYSGVAALSSDGMRSWTRVSGPDADAAGKTLLSSWFFDAKRGLALSAAGDLMQTANGGLDWTIKASRVTAGIVYGYSGGSRFQFVDAKKGWLLSGDGKVYLTDDGGETWLTPLQGTGRVVTAFHFIDAATGFALLTDGSSPQKPLLMSTSDGGRSWTQQAELETQYRDLKFSSALKGVLVGDGGNVATTADGGKTWTGRYIGSGASLRQLTLSEPGTLWMVGSGGLLKFSKDDGATWQAPTGAATASTLNAIRFLTPQQGWAVGENGTVLTTLDGGKTWSAQTSGTQRTLTQVFFVDARTGWVAGDDGTLLATGTGGQ